MNWKEFWLRLTTVLSIIAYIITVLYFAIDDPLRLYDYKTHSVIYTEQIVTLQGIAAYLIISILTPIVVWIIYFVARWVYSGLKK